MTIKLEQDENAADELAPEAVEPTNEYDEIYDDYRSNQVETLKLSMTEARKVNPDQHAEQMKLSNETGIPTDVIARQPQAAKEQAEYEQNDYDDLVDSNPALSKFLINADHAKVAKDGISELSGLEWMFKAAGKSFGSGSAQVESSLLGYKSAFNELTKAENARLEGLEKIEQGDYGAENWLSKSWVEGIRMAPMILSTIKEGMQTGLVTGTAALIAGNVGPQALVPEELITVPAATAAGMVAGSTSQVFKLEFGGAYREFSQMKDENGKPLDKDVALVAATVTGALNAGLEMFSLNVLLKSFPVGRQLLKKMSKEGIKKVMKSTTYKKAMAGVVASYGKNITAEVATEIAQETVTMFSGELAKKFSDGTFEKMSNDEILERLAETGEKTLQAMTLIGLPGPTMTMYQKSRQIRKSAKQAAAFEVISNKVMDTKLKDRSPEAMEAMIRQSLKEHGGGENLHMPVDKIDEFYQDDSTKGDKLYKDLGIEDQVDTARETGTQLKVDKAKWLANMVDSDLAKFLNDDIRFSEDGFSVNEQKDELEKYKKLIVEAEKYREEVAEPQTPEQMKVIKKQLMEALNIQSEKAERNLDLVLAGAKTFSAKRGETIQDWFNRVNLQVQKGKTEADTSFKFGANVEEAAQAPIEVTAEDMLTSMVGDIEASEILEDTVKNKEGKPVSTRKRSTYPEWYKRLGAKNKAQAIKAIQSKKGKIYERALEIAEEERQKGEGQTFEQSDVTSDNFKEWFGDSKIVDEEGAPLVVYHGTTTGGFSEFNVGWPSFEEDNISANVSGPDGTALIGSHFTDKKGVAERFSKGIYRAAGNQAQIYEVYLNVSNPIEMSEADLIQQIYKGKSSSYLVDVYIERDQVYADENLESKHNTADKYETDEKYREEIHRRIVKHAPQLENDDSVVSVMHELALEYQETLRQKGHDGIIYDNNIEGGVGYIIFDSTQAKAVSNSGTFNPKDPNVFHQTDPLGYYSELQKQVEEMDFKTIPAKDLANRIKKTQGLKAEEYADVVDWLEAEDGKVNKTEVVEFIKQGGVQIEEVVKSAERGKKFYTVYDADGSVMGDYDTNAEAQENIDNFREQYPDDDFSMQAYDDVEEGEAPTKYHNYQVPGGENYREVLLTLPQSKAIAQNEKAASDIRVRMSEIYDATRERGETERSEIVGTTQNEKGDWVLLRDDGTKEESKKYESEDAAEADLKNQQEFEKSDIFNILAIEETDAEKAELKKLRAELKKLGADKEALTKEYASPHWEEKGVLAHMRLNDRVDSRGRKTLFIEEIQSDWHQEGRKKGYKTPVKAKDFNIEKDPEGGYIITSPTEGVTWSGTDLADAKKELKIINEQIDTGTLSISDTGAVPNAPFKNSDAWAMLAFKRVLKLAVEEGYDSVSWTPGIVQAERYQKQLVEKVKQIDFYKSGHTYYTAVTDNNGKYHERIGDLDLDGLKEEDLGEIYGKDISKQIIEKATDELQSIDTKDVAIGETGMIEFYDKILKKAVEKYAKKLDSKVGVETIKTKKHMTPKEIYSEEGAKRKAELRAKGAELHRRYAEARGIAGMEYEDSKESKERKALVKENNALMGTRNDAVNDDAEYKRLDEQVKKNDAKIAKLHEPFGKRRDELFAPIEIESEKIQEEARSIKPIREETHETQDVWSLPLTDKLKEKVMAGQTLFQADKTKGPRGQINFKDNETLITLFGTANMSTFLHEVGHLFTNEMKLMIDEGLADEQTKKDYETLINFADGKLDKKGHEKIARAFESYLMTGKAPSVKLANAFSKFKTWLTNIYKTADRLNVKINDDVKQVFDRMLASEKDIEAASRYYKANESVAELINATEKQTEDLAAKKDKAKETSNQKQTERYLKAYVESIKGSATVANFKDLITLKAKAFLKDATIEIEKEESYKAVKYAIENGTLNTEEVSQKYGVEVAKTIKSSNAKAIKQKGRLSLAKATIDLEFESEDQLIVSLLKAQNIDSAIAERQESMRQAKEDKILNEIKEGESTEGDEAFHNDDQLNYHIAEAELLARKIKSTESLREANLARKARVDAIRERMARMQIRDASNYQKFSRAEKTYSDKIYEATNKDPKDIDLVELHKLKELQIINHIMVREAVKVKETVAQYNKSMKRTQKTKRGNIMAEYHEAITHIVYKLGLIDNDVTRKGFDIQELINEIENSPNPIAMPDVIKNIESMPDYKNLPYQTFLDVKRTVDIFAARGRNLVKLGKEQEAMLIEEKVEAAIAPMLDNRKNVKVLKKSAPFLWLREGFRNLMAETMHLQFDVKIADGYVGLGKKSVIGPNEQMFDAVFKAQNEAAKAYVDFTDIHLETVGEQITAMHKRLNTGSKGIEIAGVPLPEILEKNGYTGWTSEMIVALALNTGNMGNLNTIVEGFGLTPDQVSLVVSQLTSTEMQVLQTIWDAINLLSPKMFETFKKINGYDLARVEAQEQTYIAADGVEVKLKGGYYPISFDADLSRKVAGFNEKDMLANDVLSVYQRNKPADSMTKERVGSKYPIKLSIQPFYKHVTDTINYSHMAEVLSDVHKVIKNDKYADTYSDLLGKERYNLWVPWLSKVANPKAPVNGLGDRVVARYQKLSALNALGVNLLTMGKQFLSLSSTVRELGKYDTAVGMALFLKNPIAAVKFIEKSSAFMKNRAQNVEAEIAKIFEQINPFAKAIEINGKRITIQDMQEFAMKTIRLGDMLGAYPSWYAAYNKAIKQGKTQEQASHAADKLVSETQPVMSAMFKNLWQAGGAQGTSASKSLRWVIAPFTGWTMKFGSRSRTYWNGWREGKISTSEFASHVLYERILPPIGAATMTMLLRGGDDDDELMDLIAHEMVSYQVSWVPGLNQIPRVLKYGGFSGVSEMPHVKTLKLAAKAIGETKDIYDGEKEYYELIRTLGYIAEFESGVPVTKAVKEVKNISDRIIKLTD